VFLGWCLNPAGEKCVMFWSSQKSTNGYGDKISRLSTVKDVVVVRLTHPNRLYTFDPKQTIDHSVLGDTVNW
jgi:hypothetical protein